MIAIAISFPVGRYHATPFGHDLNGGLPEWPPAPWRFLRALVATWKRKLAAEAAVNGLLPQILGRRAAPPSFVLPPATLGHTRHYMPLKFPDRGDRTKVFDAFVAVDPEAELLLLWPDLDLAADRRRVLALVLSQLGYFGRAESWCTARLLPATPDIAVNCTPLNGAAPAPGQEAVRVLAAHPTTWSEWSFSRSARRSEPPWNLLAETADLHAERWSDPPGSRWLPYVRPADAFALRRPASRRPKASGRPRPTLARYALDATVLPSVTDTLPVAEIARSALLACFQRVCNRRGPGRQPSPHQQLFHSPTLSGKDEHGQPLTSHHHAYYLPTDEDGDGRLDHLTILAEAGFDETEVAALDALRRLRRKEEDEDEGLRLLLVGLGQPQDFNVPLLNSASRWVSVTPFVASRHFKRRGRRRDPAELAVGGRGREFAAAVLREELERLCARRPGLTLPEVEPLEENRMGALRLRPIEFQRFRRKPGDDSGRRAAGAFRLTFPEPIRGPLCLGSAAHFGLGLFVPEEVC